MHCPPHSPWHNRGVILIIFVRKNIHCLCTVKVRGLKRTNITILWNMTPCKLIHGDRRFRGTSYLHAGYPTSWCIVNFFIYNYLCWELGSNLCWVTCYHGVLRHSLASTDIKPWPLVSEPFPSSISSTAA
jgi:hypothetical protein